MNQAWRRLWRTMGVWGLLNLVLAVLVVGVIAADGLDPQQINLLRPLLTVLGLLVVMTLTWGLYQRSASITAHQHVLGPLLDSREEFCLLLRPFGSDGDVLVRHAFRAGTTAAVGAYLTLEQVIDRTVLATLGQRTYAMVDQDRTLAPPGPVYLRSPHGEWQGVARALILRAHTIVVVLPPGQTLRAALDWEMAQIVRARRQTRVVVVLPPPGRHGEGLEESRRQGATVLAALLHSRRLSAVPKEEVEAVLARFPPETLLMGLRRYGPGCDVEGWVMDRPPPGWLERRGLLGPRPWYRYIGTPTYAACLRSALELVEAGLAGRPFESRYPRQPDRPGQRAW